MKNQRSKMTDMLALLVFGAFALCTLLVLLTGAGVYRNLTQAGERQFQRRTAVRYLTTRVHQAESVEVESFEGLPALVIREETEVGPYLIRIYLYEGALRELYCEASAQLSPEDGEAVLQADVLAFTLEDRLLTVDLGTDQLFLHIPSGTEVGS